MLAGGLGVLASASFLSPTQAQSSDALLNKLVEKGILTTKEANDLREESQKDSAKSYRKATGMPDWVSSLRFHGDLRLRYDQISGDNPALVDRHRFRYRARFGFTAVMKEDFEVGLRLASGEPAAGPTVFGNPISNNTTFEENGAGKPVHINLVYAQWSLLKNKQWSMTMTGGKMENPFVFSDILFDPDYTPEGLAQQWAYKFNDPHAAKFNVGGFFLDEVSGRGSDPLMAAAQLRLDSAWTTKFHSSVGISGLAITGEENLRNENVPNQNRGNTRVNVGSATAPVFIPGVNFNPIVLDGSVTYSLDSFPLYPGAFPIRVGGDYVNNLAISEKNEAHSVGFTLGKSGKKGTWDLTYRWKNVGADSWFEEFLDSDTGAFYESAAFGGSAGYGAGTNLRGHWIKANYSPYNSLTIGLTYYLFDLIDEVPSRSDSRAARILLDAIWKF